MHDCCCRGKVTALFSATRDPLRLDEVLLLLRFRDNKSMNTMRAVDSAVQPQAQSPEYAEITNLFTFLFTNLLTFLAALTDKWSSFLNLQSSFMLSRKSK